MTFERTIAGYRVLRLLARGDRSHVWLAAGGTVLKVLDAPVPIEAPGREAEALHRARGDHVVELLDVSLGAEGAVLAFPRLVRGSLSEVLSRRPSLDAGEAVTILAPIATTLNRLHAAGVAHGALVPASVLFRGDGAPMLTGFGRAELFAPGLPEVELERIAAVAADRAALAALAETVLARTTGSRSKAAARLNDELRSMDPGRLAARLVSDLFELAAARPVRFDADDAEPREPVGRLVAVSEPAPVRGDEAETDLAKMSWAVRIIDSGPGSMLRAAVGSRWAGWSVRRRRATLAGVTAATALMVAIAVVPGPAAPIAAPAAGSDAPVAGETAAADGALGEAEVDDPLAALGELASRRDTCFRDLSVLCLDGVDEAGSSAWETDRAALQGVLEGGDAPPRLSLTAAILIERLGDSALVDLGPDSDPASVLLLKGEAGWRIRDYLAPAGAEDAKGG